MEPQQLVNGLQWLGGGAIVLLSLFGVGKIVEILLARYLNKKDEREDIHETNQGKTIDADIIFKQSFVDRLIRVEDKLEKAEEKLTTQLAMNAELKSDNKALRAENERQEQEIHALQAKVERLEKEIAKLRQPIEVKLVETAKK